MPEIPGHGEIREKVRKIGKWLGSMTLEVSPAFEDGKPAPDKPSYLETHLKDLEEKIREIIELNKPANYTELCNATFELKKMIDDFKERVTSSRIHNIAIEKLSGFSADTSELVSGSMEKIENELKKIDIGIDIAMKKAVQSGLTDKRKSPTLVEQWEEIKNFIENLEATEERKRRIFAELIHKDLFEAMEESFREVPLKTVLRKLGKENKERFNDALIVVSRLKPVKIRFLTDWEGN